ncbi:MAG: Mini-ribonuclease 3 [Spirochaetales bacterium]
MKEFEELINSNSNVLTGNKQKDYNSLVFAFVGDAVHTLFVRTYLAEQSTAMAGKLHSLTSKHVNAGSQAKLLDSMTDMFTEEELQIIKTARNVKNKTIAKHASIEDYKKATGFEALIGYLYLTGKNERLIEILEKSKGYMGK